MEELRTVTTLIKKRKRDILLIALWTIAIALVFIRNHQQFYIDTPMMSYYQIGYLEYRGPAPTELDLAVILLVSVAASIFLLSIKSVIFGYFASSILSCAITVLYVFLFNWYALGLGRIFLELPFGWEWVLFQAIINVFRYTFPLVFTFSLVGVGIGSVLRVLVGRD